MAKSWEAWKNHGINIWKIWKRHHENHAFPCISGDLKTLRKGLPGSHYHTSGWLLEGHTMVASPPMASITTPLLTVCFFTLQQSCGWLGPGWGLNLEVWRFGCTFAVSETRAQTVARFLRSWRSGSFGGEFQASMAVNGCQILKPKAEDQCSLTRKHPAKRTTETTPRELSHAIWKARQPRIRIRFF
jgi:hypothetical protein